jgi:alcohol dehydrogenase class IV
LNLDFLPESARIAGLGPLMKGVGTVARRLPIPQPTLLVGAGSSARLGQAVAAFGHRRVLVVTDRVIVQLGLHRPLVDALAAGGVQVAVFDAITPDAPIPLIEQGVAAYREHDADTMVAIGGGSSIDASKELPPPMATMVSAS